MKIKILALMAAVAAIGIFSFARTRNAPPPDLRDAMSEGAPEFNTDIRTFSNDSNNFPVPKAERVKTAEIQARTGPYAVYSPVGVSSVTVDSRTGLVWITNPDDAGIGGIYNWTAAVKACAGLKYAGFSDWRLPEAGELAGIVDPKNPAAAAGYFLNTRSAHYWTATTHQTSETSAWVVLFNTGYTYGYNKTGRNYIRCVRKSGKSSPK